MGALYSPEFGFWEVDRSTGGTRALFQLRAVGAGLTTRGRSGAETLFNRVAQWAPSRSQNANSGPPSRPLY